MQAISNVGCNPCGCGEPIYIAMKTSEDGSAPGSYPVEVSAVDDSVIGVANNKQEFIDLWNSNEANQAVGILGDLLGDFSFTLCLKDGQESPGFVIGKDGSIVFSWTGPEERYLNIGFDEAEDHDVLVSWGDGNIYETTISDLQAGVWHTYPKPGKYEVKIFSGSYTVLGITSGENGLTAFKGIVYPSTLQTLNLAANNLTAFDTSNLPDLLRTLDLSGNNIASFDASHLPIALQSLNVNGNRLTSFDASSLPNSLQNLDAGGNSLAAFDATNLPLSMLVLYLGGNLLTGFDASNLPPLLNYLSVQENKIPSENIDAILIKLDAGGLENGEVFTDGQTPQAIPGDDGQTAKTNLEGKGWTVQVDSVAPAP